MESAHHESVEEQEDMQKDRYLTFILAEQIFGLEICFVTEIIGLQPITPLPEAPEYVRGVINLRGKIIPVLDVRLKFRMQPEPYNDRTCIIVVNIKDIPVGLIVDHVDEVLTIGREQITPPPEYGSGTQNRYISGIGKAGDHVHLLLDCEKLLREDEIAQLKV